VVSCKYSLLYLDSFIICDHKSIIGTSRSRSIRRTVYWFYWFVFMLNNAHYLLLTIFPLLLKNSKKRVRNCHSSNAHRTFWNSSIPWFLFRGCCYQYWLMFSWFRNLFHILYSIRLVWTKYSSVSWPPMASLLYLCNVILTFLVEILVMPA